MNCKSVPYILSPLLCAKTYLWDGVSISDKRINDHGDSNMLRYMLSYEGGLIEFSLSEAFFVKRHWQKKIDVRQIHSVNLFRKGFVEAFNAVELKKINGLFQSAVMQSKRLCVIKWRLVFQTSPAGRRERGRDGRTAF